MTRADDGAPISGKTITFSVPGLALGGSCHATTNPSGVASCSVSPALVITLGSASYTASFAGDADYLASSANCQLSSGITVGGLAVDARFAGAGHAPRLHAMLSRGGVVYASGSARIRHGVAWIKPKLRHRLQTGQYTLTVGLAGSNRTIKRTINLR